MDRETEIGLARRLIAGEADAFDRFVEHFRAKIFHYSWLMCGDREDGEEVAQEALLRVFENFHQLRDPTQVRSWVYRIARNECLMKRRKSVFAPDHELPLDDYSPTDECALPDGQLLNSELRDVLTGVIAELAPAYRSVILLRDVEELSTLETAHVLDLSEDTVKTRLHRARLELRRKLGPYVRAGVPALN